MKYSFFGKYSENDKNRFITAQESDLVKICRFLKVPLKVAEKFKYKIYLNPEDKRENDPNHSISRASARFGELTIYRVWSPKEDPHFPHELTHLVADASSKSYYHFTTILDTFDGRQIEKTVKMVSTSFFQEGLAIAVDEIVFARKLREGTERKFSDEWCRKNINRIPRLEEVINFDGFCSHPNEIVVPFAASFSKFLILRYGIKKFREMYELLRETFPPEENIKTIEKVFQGSAEELINSWKKSLLI